MILFSLTLTTALFLLTAVIWFAAKRPSYHHVRNTISELGEFGSPMQHVVSYGVFLPVGAMLLVIAYLSRVATPTVAVLSLCMGVGYAISAFFPCDRGSPVHGSVRQFIHNYVGGIEYVGGSLALWHLGWVEGSDFFRVMSVFIGISTIILLLRTFWSVRGLIQRVAEVGLFASLATAIWMS